MSEKKTKWHDGLFVSSEEFPLHTKGMGITIPYRFKRKYKRIMIDIKRRSDLPVEDKNILIMILPTRNSLNC